VTHSLSISSAPDAAPIVTEEVARWPAPGMSYPTAIKFSPDDRLVTYLLSPGRDLVQQLYAYDIAKDETRQWVSPLAGSEREEELPIEEALRRERQRQAGLGVTRYTWARHADRLLVPLPTGLYVQEGGAALRRVVAAEGRPLLDPRPSPDGAWLAYVQDAELYVVPAGGGEPRQLTFGARGTGKTHGLAEYIAQEEMARSHGFWWSDDGRWLAFAEVDETHIPIYRIMHQGKEATGEGAQEDHRYPFAGQPNARVRLGVVAREGGEPVWMDLGAEEDIYLARVDWLPDGRLAAQIENRSQSNLQLVRFDPRSGAGTVLLAESSDVWINLHDMFWPLEAGGFVWASERDGFRHLYLYDGEGRLLRRLTSGEWMVDALAAVDEQAGMVYFTATKATPTESHLYAVPLAGGEPRRLTGEPGMHTVTIDWGCRRFVDVYHSLTQPPVVTLRSLADGAHVATLFDSRDPRVAALGLEPPEIVTLRNRAGVQLYGILYRPPAVYGPGPYPTVVQVYGGPHAQLVVNGWQATVAMRAQYLRRQGYLVFVLDNRGSARRGLAFEGAIRHDMGHLEVEDQVDGVRWLVAQGLADPARVGIYGWSYGGYMAAMSLLRAPETFRAAVAGAPVTSWDGYDTHYTERYMGTPANNAAGYAHSRVMAYVEQMTGSLMLVHGLIDENVHFRHTARLIDALIAARKPYELLLFPDERHMPRRLADRVYMEERIFDFLKRHLQTAGIG
jgi:dipeptidyl-peptidase-4